MLPEIWGKYGWNFLHLVTMGYPEYPTQQDKENYYNYFYYLQFVLPCSKCRKNMSDHLKKIPLTNEILSSRTNLVNWGIDLHNIVNYSIGKPVLTYDEAMKNIDKLMHNDNKMTVSNVLYLIIFIVAVIIILYLLYKCFLQKKLN